MSAKNEREQTQKKRADGTSEHKSQKWEANDYVKSNTKKILKDTEKY